MCSIEICARNPGDSKARISFAALQPVSWPFVASVEGKVVGVHVDGMYYMVLYGTLWFGYGGKSLRCHVVAWFCPGAAPRLETHALKLLVKVQDRCLEMSGDVSFWSIIQAALLCPQPRLQEFQTRCGLENDTSPLMIFVHSECLRCQSCVRQCNCGNVGFLQVTTLLKISTIQFRVFHSLLNSQNVPPVCAEFPG